MSLPLLRPTRRVLSGVLFRTIARTNATRALVAGGAIGALGAGAPLAAQPTAIVDEGSFTVTRRGERVGRENFSIIRMPSARGAEYVAKGAAAYGERRLDPALRTDSAGTPISYQVGVRTGADVEQQLTAQVMRGRLSAKVQTPAGVSVREYLVSDGALLLDDGLFHQLYFLARDPRAQGGGTIPVVVPQRSTQVSVRVKLVDANDSVRIGGRSLRARHFSVSEPGGETREVWSDADGRVLRVTMASSGLVAQRDDPPR